jgi:hypothetical protein
MLRVMKRRSCTARCSQQWLFRFAGRPLLNHPALFSCLGIVIGVYGIVYAEVAQALS